MNSIVDLIGIAGCGLIGGVFFAFSTFVMKALGNLPADQGIRAMQSINVTVVKSAFLAVFLLTAAVCAIIAVHGITHWHDHGCKLRVAGAVCYLLGTFLVTMVCNVPLNNALANLQADAEESADVWKNYQETWNRWNHVRTVTSLAAMLLLLVSTN